MTTNEIIIAVKDQIRNNIHLNLQLDIKREKYLREEYFQTKSDDTFRKYKIVESRIPGLEAALIIIKDSPIYLDED